MKIFVSATAILLGSIFAAPAMAQDSQCGEVSIAQMGWASAEIITEVAKFLLEQGYGCKVDLVKSDTIPAITSVAENGKPDIVTDLWLNSAGEAYTKLEKAGTMVTLNNVLAPGGIEGWWLPTYLVEAHPELATIEGVMANPALVGAQFNNCPEGWGCRVVSDNLVRALNLEASGIKVFNHGSGETLASSMGSAVTAQKPWFGYYWGPTVPLGKYKMTRVALGAYDAAKFANLQNPNAPDPQVSDFPEAPSVTAVTAALVKDKPDVVEFLRKMAFQTSEMSALLAWQDENKASAQEAAVQYITMNSADWSTWLSDGAREKLATLIK
ncbi:glycine betaine ABC transporter substrate-binding protein [Brucella thiophenivorans]|uniref:Substrate binding domain of ABC-type glycine betaine transport system family protein n=1 Tax=Brucella thiophenivorans TaxID=571255 RepID=A0A256EYI5_9HYPH|nr:glycine betaine ABC transporter substrate-binding protein [Brucella thiophenivorans]OYR07667.1 substrate binding domain of ABC-type glycine betaine transport system family protein [Brucella thiophenivorans]